MSADIRGVLRVPRQTRACNCQTQGQGVRCAVVTWRKEALQLPRSPDGSFVSALSVRWEHVSRTSVARCNSPSATSSITSSIHQAHGLDQLEKVHPPSTTARSSREQLTDAGHVEVSIPVAVIAAFRRACYPHGALNAELQDQSRQRKTSGNTERTVALKLSRECFGLDDEKSVPAFLGVHHHCQPRLQARAPRRLPLRRHRLPARPRQLHRHRPAGHGGRDQRGCHPGRHQGRGRVDGRPPRQRAEPGGEAEGEEPVGHTSEPLFRHKEP